MSYDKKEIEEQIKKLEKEVGYDTRDYTIEYIVDKFKRDEFIIPKYQRNFIWNDKYRSAFIESIFLGLPIPFMFFCLREDGNFEIIDGAQRVQSLVAFVKEEYILKRLEKLDKLNGTTFQELDNSRQKKFLNKTIRIVILNENTSEEVRRDLFHRINSYGLKANFSEIKKGSLPTEFVDFIDKCSENKKFIELTPMKENKEKRFERFELTLRFFALLNDYENFKKNISTFLDDYLVNNADTFTEDRGSLLEKEFLNMLKFVENNFGRFTKNDSKSITRLRFEIISVGSALALREKKDLKVKDSSLIDSNEFNNYTTQVSNPMKLREGIDYFKNKLLNNV